MFSFNLRHVVVLTVVLASPLLMSGSTVAGPTDAQKCLSAKLKTLSKYELCIWKVRAIAALLGTAADTGLCDTKFTEAWAKPDAKYGNDCPDVLAAPMKALVADHVADVLVALTAVAPACGNGLIDAGETCDGANLGGAVCGESFVGGTPSCSPTCTVDYSTCTPCDLLDQDCGAGEGCYYASGNTCAAVVNVVGEGQTCQFLNNCDAGYQCVGDPTAVCRQFCRLSTPSCAAGRTCVAVEEFGADVGICLLTQ